MSSITAGRLRTRLKKLFRLIEAAHQRDIDHASRHRACNRFREDPPATASRLPRIGVVLGRSAPVTLNSEVLREAMLRWKSGTYPTGDPWVIGET
jgi:hypothetical protein